MALPKEYQLHNLNSTQRAGLAGAMLALILLIVLHNPFDGYTVQIHKEWKEKQRIPGACTIEEYGDSESLRYTGSMDFDSYVKVFSRPAGSEKWSQQEKQLWQLDRLAREKQLTEKCFWDGVGTFDETLPFDEWRSNSPLVAWLGSIVHLLGALVALGAAAVGWLTIYRDRPKQD